MLTTETSETVETAHEPLKANGRTYSEIESNQRYEGVSSSRSSYEKTMALSLERLHQKRKQRSCCTMMYPTAVILLLLLCAISFFTLKVYFFVQTLSSHSSPSALDILNWSVYAVVLAMTAWSFYQIVFSLPGYVPRCYRYNDEYMSEHDRMIYKVLRE